MQKELREKYKTLLKTIRTCGRAAIAFSGGVDSTLLVFAASEAIGQDNIICLTARAASYPERELKEAEEFCREMNVRQVVFDFDEFGVEGFSSNPPERCYLCKKELFSRIIDEAACHGSFSVLEGSNKDDESDFRPGMKALAELGIKSPLLEAGLGKKEIRAILKEFNLPVWNKPSYACLASRFVYGEEITREKIYMVGKAEQFLLDRGFDSVRVRIQGSDCYTARIETKQEDINRLANEPLRSEAANYLKEIGFTYVSLDLSGYRTGSMNEALFFTIQDD